MPSNSTQPPDHDRSDSDLATPTDVTRRDFTRWLGAAALGAGHPFGSANMSPTPSDQAPLRSASDEGHEPPAPSSVPAADLCFTSAVDLAAMIRAKKVSAREV